jgi:hypothetical protein
MKTRAQEDLTDLPLDEVLALIKHSEEAYAAQERINQANVADYPPLPEGSDSDLTELDQQQDDQHPPIIPPTTMSIPPIPKFKGRDDPDWLDTFEIGMMDRGKDGDDAYMAKYFGKMMTRESPAETWYSGLPLPVKASYALLKTNWKAEFLPAETNKTDHIITKFLNLKLPDTDIGARDPGVTKQRHVTFAEQAKDLAASIPTTEITERVKTRTLYAGLGPCLKKHLTGLGLRDASVKDITAAIKDLTPDDIRDILEPIRMARRIQELENRPHSRPQPSYPTPPPSAFRPPPPAFPRNQPQQRQRDNGYQPRPPPAQPDHESPPQDQDYASQMRDWEQRFGVETIPTLQTGYPLTPNTAAPGTGECFRCGQRGHQKKDCRDDHMIPYKEGTYRYLVYVSKQGERSIPQPPTAPAPNAVAALGLVQVDDTSIWPGANDFATNEYLEPGNGNGYLQ